MTRDVEVYIKKGTQPEYRLSGQLSEGCHVLTADIAGPQITPTYQTYSGVDGAKLENITFGQNTFTLDVLITGRRKSEFRLLRDEFFRHFYGRSAIQVRTSLEPAKAMYVVPKPIEVKPEKGFTGAVFSLQLDVLAGYRHTPFKSNELAGNADKLQFGMNLDLENLPIYAFKKNKFTVFNPSDVTIDPYVQHHDLNVVVKGVGSKFKVHNKTNETSVTINQSLKKGQSFTLNGIRSAIDGNSNIETDYGHIVLNKGDNDIEITGLSDVDVTFSFPFLYF